MQSPRSGWFPARNEKAPRTTAVRRAKKTSENSTQRHEGIRILIFDDTLAVSSGQAISAHIMCNLEYRIILKWLPPLALAAVAAVGAASCKRSTSEPPSAVRRADASGPVALPAGPCRTDAECALVDEGCCSCREGGRRVALLSARLR